MPYANTVCRLPCAIAHQLKKGKFPDRNQKQQIHPWIIGNRFRPGKLSYHQIRDRHEKTHSVPLNDTNAKPVAGSSWSTSCSNFFVKYEINENSMLWKNAEEKSWSENLNGKMRYCYHILRLTRPDFCGISPLRGGFVILMGC